MSLVTGTLIDFLGEFKNWLYKTALQDPLETKDVNLTKDEIRVKDSLMGINKALIVEPTFICTKSVADSKVFDQLLSLNLDLFTSFYVQAFYIITDVIGHGAIEAIDILSTNKYTGAAMERYARKRMIDFALNRNEYEKPLCSGDIDFSNPLFLLNQEEMNELREIIEVNLEAKPSLIDYGVTPQNVNSNNTQNNQYNNQYNNKTYNTSNSNNTVNNTTNNTTNNIHQPENRNHVAEMDIKMRLDAYKESVKRRDEALSQILVRQINVRASRQKNYNPAEVNTKYETLKDFIIPITLIASVEIVPVEEIIIAVSNYDYKKSFAYRFREWRSGGLSLGDLIFAGDLIKEYKSNKLSKNSKLMTEIEDKKNSANVRKALTAKAGTEVTYNMIMMGDYELSLLEKAYNKKLNNFNNRETFLKVMNAHNLTIVNEDAERVNIYISEINGSMDIGFGRLSKRNEKDTNMLEFFRAMVANTAPRF